MKVITCPHCHTEIEVHGLGRRRLNLAVKNVLDALSACHNVQAAAVKLGCSRGYLYQVLKVNGLKAKDVLNGNEVRQ